MIEELSVFENVELALEYTDTPAKERRIRVAAMLEKLGIQHRAKHRPSQLSGGQQQRVAIARALVANPAVLLADEPTGNLDTASQHDILELLTQMHQQGLGVIVVTHDEKIIPTFRRIYHIRDGVTHEEAGEGRSIEAA